MKVSRWIVAMVLCLLGGIAIGSTFGKKETVGAMDLPDEVRYVKDGKSDVYRKRSETEVSHMEFSDSSGNRIIYYVCQTTYFFDRPTEIAGVDAEAVSVIVDLEWGESIQGCQVNGQEAVLLSSEDCAYLCWTVSPEYSFVIEYNPKVVAEEDIFKMAESVRKKDN